MTTLDGVERTFDSDAVLVCDRNGPSGIAGIMGGQISEVSETTTRVLLEVATWNGVNILRTSRNLGLRSDASNRFEKQLHPELALRAQRVASGLMVELCGARLVPGTIDVAADVPQAHRVSLRAGRAEQLLGMPIDPEEAVMNLRKLEFDVDPDPDGGLAATVPFHRHYDVTREADLVEEVGRIHGYSAHLPPTLPERSSQVGGLSREQALRRRAEDLIRDLGFSQVVTLSLVDPGVTAKLRTRRGRHPLESDPGFESALRRPFGAADDTGRLAARGCPAQPRAGHRRPCRVRVRARLPFASIRQPLPG